MSTVVYEADWVVPVEGAPVPGGGVAVEDGRILAVGRASGLDGERRRFEDAVILPAFVNAHCHLEYAVYAGFGDGLSFPPWIDLHVTRKRRLLDGDALAIARLGAAECLRSGIGTIGDASFTGAAAPACAELGLAGVVYLEVFGDDPAGALARYQELREDASPFASERLRLGVSPHAPYTTSGDVYEACAGLGVPVMTHLAESEAEQEWVLHGAGTMTAAAELLVEPAGRTGIRLLAERGLLGAGLVAAHCVHADEEEIGLLAEHGTAIAHCPRSNSILGCGAAPLGSFLASGARVGLGTDSPASTPSFDMFEEMRTALYTARARERRPDALSASAALELATLGAANALGLGDETGSLVAGKRADLAVVSLAGSPFLPWEEPITAVVFGGSPDRVLATLVAGEVRYEEGGFAWPELRRSASAARARLLSSVPPKPKT
ncbi:MAG TPA: amidohydrolase family protein [Gaiellaceae bacterium]|nr:amidohydrolase family protein [Gaiellaceae bacterium]